MTAYVDTDTFSDYLGGTNATSEILLEMAVNSASRAVDGYCQRKFTLDATPVARTFVPDDLLNLRDLPDIGSTDGLVLKTDPSGDGTYEIVWSASDYQLLPQNAPYATPEAKPWTAIRAVGTKTFPWLVNTWLTHLDRVQITACWGWPAVPDAVIQATLIKAARIYFRKDSPQGVAGFDQFGPVRISRQDDPDVMNLLSDYRRDTILVA